jgi:hypothetical protein
MRAVIVWRISMRLVLVAASTPAGTYLISVVGPAGKRSNLLPLTVTN